MSRLIRRGMTCHARSATRASNHQGRLRSLEGEVFGHSLQ
jgi:hypothetical protein